LKHADELSCGLLAFDSCVRYVCIYGLSFKQIDAGLAIPDCLLRLKISN